ncbi:hypothetical protein THUN1379_06750 [Paludibacterium sp. THUN1379]|nr:hypothetical protein THUN1379_06750 [Paludibacterium sp. THUN1379]
MVWGGLFAPGMGKTAWQDAVLSAGAGGYGTQTQNFLNGTNDNPWVSASKSGLFSYLGSKVSTTVPNYISNLNKVMKVQNGDVSVPKVVGDGLGFVISNAPSLWSN